MQGDARQAEQRVAGIDRLGDAIHGPQRRPMTTLTVAVLDIVVDEAEVVPQLHRGSAGKRLAVVARDRRVSKETEQRPNALTAIAALPVERKVVADHLI